MANNWAIVAGINDYDFLPGSPLKFAVADALAMRSFLRDDVGFKSDQVLFCGDGMVGSKQATRSVLRDILLHQIQRAKNADNLWFFFSGHGIAEHLMPIDGNPRDLSGTAISIHFVTEHLRKCNAKNIVLVLDMCRSEGRDPDERNVESIEVSLRELVKQREGQQGIITLFSCGRGESSYEVQALGQGAFTYALLEGLRKTTIVKDLEQHLALRVPELNQASGKVRKQVPLVIPEPGYKYHEPILSSYATEADVARLKEMAIVAELKEEFENAKRLLLQIIEFSEDKFQRSEAMAALDRIEQKLSRRSIIAKSEPGNTFLIPISSPTPLPPAAKPSDVKPCIKALRDEGSDADDLSSEQFGDNYYAKLRDLLAAQDWKDADEETANRMCEVMNKQKEGQLKAEDLKKFPSQDLHNIDSLWVKYSRGIFGFSIQKKIYLQCGAKPNGSYPGDRVWDKFGDQVGWRVKRNWIYQGWLHYKDAIFDTSASLGHLPWRVCDPIDEEGKDLRFVAGFGKVPGKWWRIYLFSRSDL